MIFNHLKKSCAEGRFFFSFSLNQPKPCEPFSRYKLNHPTQPLLKKIVILSITGLLLTLLASPAQAQKKFQSLFWKVTDPKTGSESYLYGTMHVSGKLVFQLGDPFYKAIEQSDVVALELEPDAWLEAIFTTDAMKDMMGGLNFGKDAYAPLYSSPPLAEKFKLETDFVDRIKGLLMNDPSLLNYMLFRYGESNRSGDFEENTWLDMYIYQTGKKLGKTTFGLETFEQSTEFLKKAEKAESEEDKGGHMDWDKQKERNKLSEQLEPAYRRQDLDLVDSITRYTSGKAFNKYILIERNKVFVHNIDSLIRSGKKVFAGMGCAHLPGEEGVIEMLRNMGYVVEPIDKGERDARKRKQLDLMVVKKEYTTFTTTYDGLSFSTPSKVYPLGSSEVGKSWLSMDIANGANFGVYRVRTYGGLKGRNPESVLQAIDSVLYEAVAGELVSQKRIVVQGHPAIDLVNKTRRGDYQRKLIIALDDELVIMKVSASGEKVKNGFGNEFFNSIKIKNNEVKPDPKTRALDGSFQCEATVPLKAFQPEGLFQDIQAREYAGYDSESGAYYLLRKVQVDDPGFFDDDVYEMQRLLDQFEEDNELKGSTRLVKKIDGRTAVSTTCSGLSALPLHAMAISENLNYYLLLAATPDTAAAQQFFRSISFSLPTYGSMSTQTDTLNFFSVRLPFKLEQEEDKPSGIIGLSNNKKKNENPSEGRVHTRALSENHGLESVGVKVERYHEYYYESDSIDFFKSLKNEVTNYGDFVTLSEKVTKTPTGVQVEYLLSDTSCLRQQMVKHILHHSTLYSLKANVDSKLGPSEFVKEAFQSFTPTDTVFQRSIFKSNGRHFLKQLASSDSSEYSSALELISEVTFDKSDAAAIRETLRSGLSMKQEDRHTIKDVLTSTLWRDGSKENIDFLTKEFYANMDSAGYQLTILNALAGSETKDGMLKCKELLMAEPPLASLYLNSNPFFAMRDSFELSRLMYPEIMQLTALDEYEMEVYSLLSDLLDSNLVKKEVYDAYYKQILFEAKTELKRASTTDEEYRDSHRTLTNFLNLLRPYAKNTEVVQLHQKVAATKRMDLLMDYLAYCLKHDINIADSLVQKIGQKKQDDLLTWYYTLKSIDKLSFFPASKNNRELLLSLYVNRQYAEDESLEPMDSIVVTPEEAVDIRGRHYEVYRVKFREKSFDEWNGTVIMLGEEKNVVLPDEIIQSNTSFALSEDSDEDELYDREVKKMIQRNRFKRHGINHFESYYYDWDY